MAGVVVEKAERNVNHATIIEFRKALHRAAQIPWEFDSLFKHYSQDQIMRADPRQISAPPRHQ
jgi:hypothetical protein